MEQLNELLQQGFPVEAVLLFFAWVTFPASLAVLALALIPKHARAAVVLSTVVMATGVFAFGVGTVGSIAEQRDSEANAKFGRTDGLMVEDLAQTRFNFGLAIGLAALISGAVCLTVQLRRLPSVPG